MLWLCLHLPLLALEALRPEHVAAAPLYVWHALRQGGRGSASSGQRLVCCSSAAAQALGVVVGQRVSTAQMLAPEALALARQPQREAELLQRLALALGQLTPQISLAGPAELLLEIHASLRLFGGVRRLLRLALAITRSCGCRPRLALASTPLAARLFARHGGPRRHGERPARCLTPASTRRRLLPLPLATLAELLGPALPPAALEFYQALGLRRLADLAALPRSGLARRGGLEWLAALDRTLGDAPDSVAWFVPPEQPRFELVLDWRADHAGALVEALRQLLPPLCGWLALRWRAAQVLGLQLRHERRPQHAPPLTVHGLALLTDRSTGLPLTQLTLELASPSRTPEHLLTLLGERLNRLQLAAPVYALTLELVASTPLAGHAASLLPPGGPGQPADPAGQATDIASLIDRLCARLGPERVLRLSQHDDPRPERASLLRPAGLAAAPPAGPGHQASPHARPARTRPIHHPRPAWLLPDPLPLAAHAGRPLQEGTQQPLRLLTRAERIEAGWFDDALVRRDYYVALGQDGLLRWVYRERPASTLVPTGPAAAALPASGPPRWFLHGLFA